MKDTEKYWIHFYNHVGRPDKWTGYHTNNFEDALAELKTFKSKVCISELIGNKFKYTASNIANPCGNLFYRN